MSSQCGCQSGQACSCQEGQCKCGGNCECGGHHAHGVVHYHRTKAEHIAEMEAYLHALRTEMRAVEEHLAGLRQVSS